MMTIGLHCRLARPGPTAGLSEFIDFCLAHRRDIWICTREQIADHWYKNHPPRMAGEGPPGTPITESDHIRTSWKGPASEEKTPMGENSESEVNEADGDII